MSGITAVVLSYNKKWVIDKFARTLMRQTMKPEKVIIVDDGSRDGTQRVVNNFPDAWQKIMLSRNRGQSYARNVGARSAVTEFIIFLDGDIDMHPRMLALMRETLVANSEASFAYCHYNRSGSRRDPMKARPWNKNALRYSNYISMMTLIRRKHLPSPPFDVALRKYEDWDLWRRMAKAGRVGVLVNHILFTAHYDHTDVSGNGESRGWYNRVLSKNQGP